MKSNNGMGKRQRGALLQNLSILCLSVMAVGLLVAVFSYEAGGDGPISSLSTLLGAPAASTGEPQSPDLGGMAAPFNLVATSEQGRYGRMLAGTAEREQLHASNLLLEALGSAGNSTVVTEEAFRAALEETGLFLDYLFPVPASVLAGWYGADFSGDAEVRYLLLSASGGEGAQLFLWDGAGSVYRYDTAVEQAVLEELIRSFRQESGEAAGDVAFAFEDPETYGHLSPYTVLSSEAAQTMVLTASLPELASDVDTLLDMLDFNPHTIARYNLTDGIEVVEFPRTFRVYHDGVIRYSGDVDDPSALYAIPAAGETPTQAEAVLAARRLAEVLLPGEVLLDTDFYFTGIEATETGYAITFDYMVDGIPVYLSSGDAAMEVRTTGSTITYFRLQYRQYTAAEESYHLLPLAQAVHLAGGYEETVFLTKGYVDRGGETVRAQWLVR